MTNYVYLAFGAADRFYTEAAYSIGTLLKQIDPAVSRVIVYTDNPGRVRAWPVICEPIADELAAMKGSTGFGFRVKLCVIAKAFERYAGNLIFLDSDTFIRGRMQTLAEKLRPGHGLMDLFYHRDGQPLLTGFQTTLPDGTVYRYEKASCVYNSGVIGLHQTDRQAVTTALNLCDAFLEAGYRRHTLEQFAISEAMRLRNIQISLTKSVIIHYYRTPRRKYMHRQFARRLAGPQKEPWRFDPMIPYSLPRVYWNKLRDKFRT